MNILPTGTVTFLFTDIEGSTGLWEQHPEAMRSALARHDALLRQAVDDSGGFVFKTVGDAFCAAFATAPEALTAALSAQLALSAEAWDLPAPLGVRMALHTGACEERGGDYFGPPLNRVARLLAAGHGGQVLLSDATQALVRDGLPEGVLLRDLGEHRLRDLGRPETVFQVLHPDLPADFPPLRSLDNPELPNNLPQQPTSFIGREKEIAEVKALMQKSRLVTLTGPGGAGKTRLSLQVAADILDQFPDGAWLVELAPLADPALVPQTIAGVLGVSEQPGKPLAQTLGEWLKAKDLLLILDNCEHLLAACATLAASLLKGCPGVRLLASSREPLTVGGEQTYRIPSLSLPDPRATQTAESLSQYEAVTLFVARAQAVQPSFTVTDKNAPAVAQVCWRLDGIPLAIELAAALVRAVPAEQINLRLDDRFRLLRGGSRTALPRQQTLQAMIDWSYDLLNDPEKTVLCRLSVFAGGWTLDAAEGVCAGEGLEAGQILELSLSLVDKNLVDYDDREGEGRYRLLETVRRYAAERLAASGEEPGVRNRHRDYFLALTQDVGEGAAWLTRMELEHDNVRTALLSWLEAAAPSETHFPAFMDLSYFWSMRGYRSEGRDWLERAVRKVENSPVSVQCRALSALELVAGCQTDYERAIDAGERAVALSRETGDENMLAESLSYLGYTYWQQPDYGRAKAVLNECRTLSRTTGVPAGWPLTWLGGIACEEGRYADAALLCEEGMALFDLDYDYGRGLACEILARVALAQADDGRAKSLFAESLRRRQALGHKWGISLCLEGFAALAAAQAHFERSVRLYGAAEALRRQHELTRDARVREEVEERLAAARQALGDAPFAAAFAQGQAMTLDEAVEYALADEE